MDAGKRYIVLKAFEKALKDALGEANVDIRAELEALSSTYGVDRINVRIGDTETKVTLVQRKAVRELVGSGAEFMEFMADHGMVRATVDESWTEHAAEVGGDVVWLDTGEVIPGARASVKESAPYPKVSGLKPAEVLRAANAEGLLEPVAVPLLERGTDGD